MKSIAVGLLLVFSVSVASALDFITTDGLSYSNATVKKVEPDGITVKYAKGVAKIPFETLPKSVQAQYNYDPVKAEEYRTTQAQRSAAAAGSRQAVFQQGAERDLKQVREMDAALDKSATLKRLTKEATDGAVTYGVTAAYMKGDGWLCYASAFQGYSKTRGSAGKRNTLTPQYSDAGNVLVIGMGGFYAGKTWQGKLYPAGSIEMTVTDQYHKTYVASVQRFAASPELAAKILMSEKR